MTDIEDTDLDLDTSALLNTSSGCNQTVLHIGPISENESQDLDTTIKLETKD
jgi:hypothetical protein